LERAKEAMIRAVAIDAAHPSALLARGYYYYFGFRDYDRALEDFEVALEAVPNDSEVRASIGFIHRRQGKWDEAIADFGAAATLAPRDDALLSAVADIRRARREFDEAIKVRRRIAELKPENVGNLLALAALAIEGRLVQIALQHGTSAEINVLPLMVKRLTFTGSTLRPRCCSPITVRRSTPRMSSASRPFMTRHVTAAFVSRGR